MTKMFARREQSAYSRAGEEFNARGMFEEDQPETEMPRLPWDLGDLSDKTLMDLFNEFTIWQGYVGFQVAKAEIEEDEVESQLSFEESKYIVLNTPADGKGVVRAAKERRITPEVNRLRALVLETKALRKMTETLYANMERATFVLSRELSRRIGLAPAQGRLHNRTGT